MPLPRSEKRELIEEKEVLKWFGPEGNIEDYWLGTPAYDNTFLMDDEGWDSMESFLAAVRKRELAQWGPEQQSTVADMHHDYRGGGLVGLDEKYYFILSNLVAVGERALKEERRVSTLAARGRR
jgi:hypothetical protein